MAYKVILLKLCSLEVMKLNFGKTDLFMVILVEKLKLGFESRSSCFKFVYMCVFS